MHLAHHRPHPAPISHKVKLIFISVNPPFLLGKAAMKAEWVALDILPLYDSILQ